MGLFRTLPAKKASPSLPFLYEIDFPALQQALSAAPAKFEDASREVLCRIVEPALPLSRLYLPLASSGLNSVWIQGEKGVGKSTIVETLIRARAERRLAQHFLGKSFYLFDANEFFVCQGEGKLLQSFRESMDFVSGNNGLVIFDNFDDFVKMAKGEAGCLVSTLVARLEKNPSFQAIIVSEHDSKQAIEKTSTGIGRRFFPLNLTREPSPEQLRAILMAHLVQLESLHDVNFTEEAADEILRLLARFPGQAFTGAQPASAIAFADSVATHVRMNLYAAPPELAEINERLSNLKDRQAIMMSDGPEGEALLPSLSQEIHALQTQYDESKKAWEKSVAPVLTAQSRYARALHEVEILAAKGAQRTAGENAAFNELSSILDQARQEMEKAESALFPEAPRITAKHVQAVFNDQAGLSFELMNEDQKERLRKLEDALDSEIFLQAPAKKALARLYKRREIGANRPHKPAGVILFAGGTALGKTELAEVLARFDGGENARPLTIRLSEYKGAGATARLTGADPGLVGFDNGSPKLEEIVQKPRSIVLFDELDKAHPSVFDVLMQILDKGELNLSNGKLLDFTNALIILTTNAITAEDLSPEIMADQEGHQDAIREELKKARSRETGEKLFAPEFVRRFTNVYVFEPLGPEEYLKIFAKEMRALNRSFAHLDVSVEVEPETVEALISGFNVNSMGGSGPGWIVEHAISGPLTDTIAERLASAAPQETKDGTKMKVVFENGEVAFVPLPVRHDPTANDNPVPTPHVA